MNTDFDFTVSDLENFDKGRFGELLKELKARWISDYEKRNHTVRVGTAYVSNKEGLGRVELVFRFPINVTREEQ